MNKDNNQDKTILSTTTHGTNSGKEQRTRILKNEKPVLPYKDDKTVVDPNTKPTETKIKSSDELSFNSKINNRFILKEALGAGGMGVVYRAIDIRKQETGDKNPYVAIKLLSTDIEDHPSAFVSLQREANKCQLLAHPNIITVYDFDRDGDLVYLTMEELKGQPLDQLIRDYSQGLPLKMALPIITAIAEGLSYAHKKKIVHADLKPANIFYTEEGEIKIIDFGIAKVVQDIDSQQAEDQDSEAIEGLSPSYASVEMFQRKPTLPSDDIYALGVISYELLTGRHPFNYEAAHIVRNKGSKPKKITKIRSFQWAAIEKALKLDRDDRYKEASFFNDKFSGKGRLVRHLSMSLGIISLVFASYLLFFDSSNTDYLYDELASEQQEKYDLLLKQGHELLTFNDWNNALAMFEKAYEILPQHSRTNKAVDLAVTKILDLFNQNKENQALSIKMDQVNELLKYQSLKDNEKLNKYKEDLLEQIPR